MRDIKYMILGFLVGGVLSCSSPSIVRYTGGTGTRWNVIEISMQNIGILEVATDTVSNILLQNLVLASLNSGLTLYSRSDGNDVVLKVQLLGKKNNFLGDKQYFSLIYRVEQRGKIEGYLIQDFYHERFLLDNSRLYKAIKQAVDLLLYVPKK